MSDTILIRLLGESREDLVVGQSRLRAAGLDIQWRAFDELEENSVDGMLRLYDTPETVDAKLEGVSSFLAKAREALGND